MLFCILVLKALKRVYPPWSIRGVGFIFLVTQKIVENQCFPLLSLPFHGTATYKAGNVSFQREALPFRKDIRLTSTLDRGSFC